jgi:hypothetical protein
MMVFFILKSNRRLFLASVNGESKRYLRKFLIIVFKHGSPTKKLLYRGHGVRFRWFFEFNAYFLLHLRFLDIETAVSMKKPCKFGKERFLNLQSVQEIECRAVSL